jgi:hypothetical protein
MKPPLILFSIFHAGRIAKASFKNLEFGANLTETPLDQGP